MTSTKALAELAETLDRARALLLANGDDVWRRTLDWQRADRLPGETRGGGNTAPSDDAIRERAGDRKAGMLHDEYRTLLARTSADLRRLVAIHAEATPHQPRRLQGKDMLASQIAANGWCESCWRDDHRLVEIETRSDGAPYYRGLCRWCGGWKHEVGHLPSVEQVRQHHTTGRVKVKA